MEEKTLSLSGEVGLVCVDGVNVLSLLAANLGRKPLPGCLFPSAPGANMGNQTSVQAVGQEAVLRAQEPLKTLSHLLADGDPDAESHWQRHHADFCATLPHHWARLEAAIQSFDFETALNLLEEAMPTKNLANDPGIVGK